MNNPLDILGLAAQRVEAAMAAYMDSLVSEVSARHTTPLLDAMRYGLLGGGKRIRPALVYAAAESIQLPRATPEELDRIAAAVEFVHTYSLIHDDLPAMDDDCLRRGRPTCHIAFDEATAILAGDALQAHAFALLCQCDSDANRTLEMLRLLAKAIGMDGMAGGQLMDIRATGKPVSLEYLEAMHTRKTGELIQTSVLLGAIASSAGVQERAPLSKFGSRIGLAFQIKDDLLDLQGDAVTLGKHPGTDVKMDKTTYPSIAGVEMAEQRVHTLHQEAISALAPLGARAESLRTLAAHIATRDN